MRVRFYLTKKKKQIKNECDHLFLAPSQSSENQRNSDISERYPSGRITPPATNLPRFKKYAVTDFNFLKVSLNRKSRIITHNFISNETLPRELFSML